MVSSEFADVISKKILKQGLYMKCSGPFVSSKSIKSNSLFFLRPILH
jgi:hypothetical protein